MTELMYTPQRLASMPAEYKFTRAQLAAAVEYDREHTVAATYAVIPRPGYYHGYCTPISLHSNLTVAHAAAGSDGLRSQVVRSRHQIRIDERIYENSPDFWTVGDKDDYFE